MWTIRQTADGWELLDSSGVALSTHPTYDVALATLGTTVRSAMAAEAPAAVDPPVASAARWVSGDSGIVLQTATGDGRDFSDCVFSWRPLSEYPLPLMLQTETEMGHFGAVLCGWIDQLALRQDGGVDAGGAFHSTDTGVEAQQILGIQGRFGVSVDPGQVDYEDVCTAYDTEGWCTDGYTAFHAYEVIGLTMTPFPAFGAAWIQPDLAPAPAADAAPAAPAIAASGAGAPPAEYLLMPEPATDDPRYVAQGRSRVAIPLTICEPDADGWRQVYGHAAAFGTCHVGYRGECVQPPTSPSGYAAFHTGEVLAANGERIATGVLVLALDHAGHDLAAPGARDHYAHTGMGWANVRASDGVHGVWTAGYVREGVTEDVVNVARASALSGDWRTIDGRLEMVGCQSVNVPGFPIARQALAAAGLQQLETVELRARYQHGELYALAAAGMVRPTQARLVALAASGTVDCAPCAQIEPPTIQDVLSELSSVQSTLSALDLRTRHLIPAAREALSARMGTRTR